MDDDKKKLQSNGIDVTDLIEEWKKSTEFVYGYTRDFRDLDTIANAQYPRGNGKKPNVGDTTIAGTIRQMMRRAVKQLPVVSVAVNGSKSTVEAYVCRSIVNDNILNPITFGKGFVNTLQLGGRGALTRGFNVFQVTATRMFGEYGIVPRMIHFADIGIEPGVQDANHSGYWYVKTQFTPYKMKRILKREENNPNTTWNIPALKALIAAGTDGSGMNEYSEWLIPSQQSTDIGTDTYILVSRISSDPEEEIITFSPMLSQSVRGMDNRSKFGYPRVIFLVIDAAELSPFGDSRVRLASPNQNLMMALRQNVVTTWLYNSDPTIVRSGLFTGATNLKGGGTITSIDPSASIKLLTLDTSTSQQYSNISQEISGQILNMLGFNQSANLGAIGESKTGVGAQTQRMAMDDASQEITNIIQEFIKQYVLSALDLYLAEQDGDGVIYVDDDTRNDITRINPGAFPDPTDPNAFHLNWNELYEYIKKLDVTVDTTISKDDFTDEKRADLQDAVTTMKQTANPNDPVAAAKINAVEDEYLAETVPDLTPQLNNLQNQMPTPSLPASQMM